jgi:hypothetical protein
MAHGSTQPVPESFPGGKGGRSVWLTISAPLCAGFLEILGALTFRIPKVLARPLMG